MEVREASSSYSDLTQVSLDVAAIGRGPVELGGFPDDWTNISIKEIAAKRSNAIVGGPFGSDLVSKDYVAVGVPVVRGQNMAGRYVCGDFVFVSKSKAKRLKANLARPDDIVFTQRGTLGQVALVPNGPFDEYVISQSQMKLTLSSDVASAEYVYQYFISAEGQRQVLESAIQTGVPHTNLSILRGYQIPVPPTKTEQEAIAEALSDADALIESLEQLIAKKRQVKQGTMQALLTGKQRMSGFGGKLESKRLDQLGRWVGGMTPSMRNPSYWQGGTVPWISSGDVKLPRLKDTTQRVTAVALKDHTTTLVPENSIVVVMRSGILRKFFPVAMNMVPMAINQDLKALIPESGMCAEYILHALIGSGDEILARCLKSGTTVESVEFGWLKSFTIWVPAPEEQAAIATILTDMDTELAELETRLAKTRQLKQGMMQELLTGRIRLV